ncbi:MAG: electron transporter RnfE, partial [Oscillospiraceae bacterium]|nr:electron transporter RnfE [Oscillospiraceae bacterium]
TAVLLVLCFVRELLGAGPLMGAQVMPASSTPAGILVLPVGGFLCLGALIAAMQWALNKSREKTEKSAEKEAAE